MARKTSKEYLGKIYINKYGTLLKIISCQNYHHVDCLDITHNIIIKNISIGNLEKQYIKSPLDKTLYNIGYIGVGNHQPKDNLKCYRTWDNIIYRGYSEDYKLKYNTYEECTVCEEWHNFQNFADWFDKNYYEIGKERMEIDKDLLIKNNKIYRKGEEIKPDTSGTNGKVVSGMSAHGLWFSASTSTEKITIYKKDIIDLAPNAHEVFMSYII